MNPNRYQQSLLRRVDGARAYARLREWAAGADNRLLVTGGLRAAANALVFARLARDFPERPILILAPTNDHADALMDDFAYFGLERAAQYPRWESLPYDPDEPIIEIAAQQLETLAALADYRAGRARAPRVVAQAEAILRKVIPADDFDRLTIRYSWGDRVNLDDLAARLIAIGYERQTVVESRGEFSIRGNIIDVYPLDAEYPVRLDLFGDEIESIRHFDPQTQRSVRAGGELDAVALHPVRLRRFYADWAAAGKPLLPFLSLWPAETLVILDLPELFEPRLERHDDLVQKNYQHALQERAAPDEEDVELTDRDALPILPPETFFITRAEAEVAIHSFQRIAHSELPETEHERARTARFETRSNESVEPNLEAHLAVIRQRQNEGYAVHIVCDNEGQVERLDELLRENEVSARPVVKAADFNACESRDVMEGFSDVALTVGDLHAGFVFPEIQLYVLTDREIFGRYKKRRVYRKVYKGAPIAAPSEIRRGDYVVHVEHGVGEFLGIRKQTIENHTTELMEILYRDGDKLLVPLDRIRDVQKFSVVDGAAPRLDRLGGRQWAKRKSKTQEAVEELAEELLQLYARREVAEGHAYGDDTVWQREFEASFIYQETPDQLTAIDAVKQDMAAPKPMDRLVCGDVGYGKTEVAIRAIFKATAEKRQVAVLAPTTILAQQHYNTLRERFADYPIRIGMLSRFRTPAEQTEVLKAASTGEINIVVGTHRLLSKDVRFADLGLLVVDEEQRFGVKQKERIKEMRAEVDILTLTATPIPRTLYFALSGLRDMSVINTPPPDRQPIRTKVIHFDKDQIEEALLREMNRGGQIYFVHNRVHNIDQVAKRLNEIVPEARIAIGHGQMNEHELEKTMLDFIDGKHDILLATTIIENGLDIPNVNTIIINRADTFGLAQLYQLRGRVGRGRRRAYAYLVVPQGQAITETAVRRLAAIQEFTDLGSGFNIALRDMEIRGTGDLLGPRQHGAIQTVGFDLYCRMLEEAVQKMKGEVRPSDYPVEIVWKAESYLPHEYVPVETHRIALYKRLAGARKIDEVGEVLEEIKDRYGQPPAAALNLIHFAAIRVHARAAGIHRIVQTGEGFKFYSEEGPGVLAPALEKIRDATDSPIVGLRLGEDGAIHVGLKEAGEERISAAETIFQSIAGEIVSLSPA